MYYSFFRRHELNTEGSPPTEKSDRSVSRKRDQSGCYLWLFSLYICLSLSISLEAIQYNIHIHSHIIYFHVLLCNFRFSGSCRIYGRLPKPPREVGHHSFEMVLYFSNVKQFYIFFKMDILAKRMKMLYHLIFASLEHTLKIIQI